MKNIKSLLLLFIICFLFESTDTYAQMTTGGVDSLVQDAMKKFNVAGVAVAIVKDGKTIYKKGFGVKSVITKQPVNEFTDFAIASNSKAFTTTALAILVEEGKLSWNDKVKDYIPEFKMYNDYVENNFTIQDLLTHRSGLGLGAGDLTIFPDSNNFTMKDILNNFQYLKPVSAFRTKWDYDNMLYMVAGEVIARVSGMSYEAFVQKRILEPLQLNNTYSSMAAMKDKSNLAMPHIEESGVLKAISPFEDMVNGAAGGILSNANDMATWMLLHLNKGKYGNDLQKQLFKEGSQNEMWKIHTVEEVNRDPRYNSHFRGYGLGFDLTDVKGYLKVSHTGALTGMLSAVTMIPDINLGVVVLTNTENGGSAMMAISKTIIDRYIGLNNFDWVKYYSNYLSKKDSTADEVIKKTWATVNAAKNTKINNEDYIGVYQDPWFGKVEVFEKDKQLWFKSYRSLKLIGPMFFYKANTFAIKWKDREDDCDALAIFSLDEEGKAQGIKMKGISPSIDFSYDFQDLNFQRLKQ
jgi:CubicO group peptidase (beta-lactamase class C family)